MDINNMKIEFINPEIIKTKGEQYKKEGCLSVKLPFEFVRRPFEVTVTAFDRYGNKFTLTCEDWTAVCLCHETDHLDGVLYIDKTCTPPDGYEEEEDEYIRIAMIGKPNVGKSSLINKLLGEDRVIVSNVPGTTRDAIDSYLETEEGKFILIDTAGLRRKSKVKEEIERYYKTFYTTRAYK